MVEMTTVPLHFYWIGFGPRVNLVELKKKLHLEQIVIEVLSHINYGPNQNYFHAQMPFDFDETS